MYLKRAQEAGGGGGNHPVVPVYIPGFNGKPPVNN